MAGKPASPRVSESARGQVKRTPLRRYTRLEARTPIRHSAPRPRDRGELEDPAYLAHLRTRPCRIPGCPNSSEAHHLRHDENGAGLGARIKDDRRAISLCHTHHVEWLHAMPWRLRALLGCDDLKAWQDEQLAIQRAEYLRQTLPAPALVQIPL